MKTRLETVRAAILVVLMSLSVRLHAYILLLCTVLDHPQKISCTVLSMRIVQSAKFDVKT